MTVQGDNPDEVPGRARLPFNLLRRASWGTTFNASPEPVKKGAKISIKATLKHVNWSTTKTPRPYIPYGHRTIRVQFKAAGTKSYVTIKSVTTSSEGRVSTTVPAVTTGSWRLHYGGNSATSPADTPGDNVAVS